MDTRNLSAVEVAIDRSAWVRTQGPLVWFDRNKGLGGIETEHGEILLRQAIVDRFGAIPLHLGATIDVEAVWRMRRLQATAIFSIDNATVPGVPANAAKIFFPAKPNEPRTDTDILPYRPPTWLDHLLRWLLSAFARKD